MDVGFVESGVELVTIAEGMQDYIQEALIPRDFLVILEGSHQT
jgi:hypothetical protein